MAKRWQPMSTCPKDRQIQLRGMSGADQRERVHVAQYDSDWRTWRNKSGFVVGATAWRELPCSPN